MKKLLFLLFFVTSFNAATAQSVFNEDDLMGEWVTNQSNPLKITGFFFAESYYSGLDIKIVSRMYYYDSTRSLSDYFISPSNRLHLMLWNTDDCWIFKIISLTSDKMVLSYKYKDRYSDGDYETYEIEFYKKEDVSAINEISNETTDSDKIYNLKGQLLENEPDSGVYIQNGKKYVKK